VGAIYQLSAKEGKSMILSDREIEALLDDGIIRIDPRPDKRLWSSTAIDLTLDKVLLKWTPNPYPSGQPNEPRPLRPNFDVLAMMEDSHYATKMEIDPEQGYRLQPKTFVLGFTREIIQFPTRSRIAARVEGKSSLARLGVGVHVTAPTIHAGFGAKNPASRGTPIQLEIFNLGEWTVVLDIGMPICQLIFEEVRELPRAGYGRQFSEQTAFALETPALSGPTAPNG
jgi:dCTP deaminase